MRIVPQLAEDLVTSLQQHDQLMRARLDKRSELVHAYAERSLTVRGRFAAYLM